MATLSRRNALKLGIGAGGGIIGVLLSIPAIGLILSPLFIKQRISWTAVGEPGAIDRVPTGVPTPFVVAVPTGEGWTTPAPERIVYVVRKEDGTLRALSNICTHMQCPVHWERQRQEFLCPCHGGLYDLDGRNVGGPPPQPLPEWEHRVRRDGAGRTILEISNQLTEAI